jgi:CBS domain-containing protein
MKVREIMTPDPVCCTPEDSAQKVATMLRSQDIWFHAGRNGPVLAQAGGCDH